MIATAADFQHHPNIGAIYDDMVKEAASPVPRAHVKTFTVSTKTFDGADVSPTTTSNDEGMKTFISINTKTFDGAAPKKSEKRSFSRKNSTDSLNSAFSVMSEKQKSSNIRPMNRNFSRKNSTDSAFSIYNDDDMWSQRIGEIMNRDVGAAVLPPSSSQEQQQHQQPPVDNIRVSSSSGATSSSSRPKIRRCQSTDCPFTMLQSQQGRENAWLKKQQFGGSLSRRNSMEGNRKDSRSTSPRFVPPLDSFDSDGSRDVSNLVTGAAAATTTTKSTGGFSRRNSMTRSRSPKFIEPLDSSNHDESREFKGRVRRHTLAGANPFATSRHLETLRERRANDEGSSAHNIAEQVKQRLQCLEEPSTPKADAADEQNTVPRKPFSRHNSVEGVDPSIFPSLPMLDKSDKSDDTDPNFDLAMLFEQLVDEEEADDVSSDEEDEDDKIIQRHMKSKIRRRCSTGGLRSFERENFRNFIEDTEGDAPVRSVPEEDRRSSLFRKCSTGGLRTLQRENSRDLYSDDCSLDGKKGRVHLSNDTSFNAYLKKLTRDADVDTSNDAKIIDQHVGGAVRRRSSIRSVSSFANADEDPIDFAEFISRVGQGVSSSQTVSTVANTSCSEESYGSPRAIETVRSLPKKKKLPHSIHMSSALDESVSSLDISSKAKDSPVSIKDSAEVNFRSSKSRSIRRLASSDGIEELNKLAQCMESSATRRSSCSGIRTPDPEEIVLKDLPCLIKNIDRDLATERAAYQQRRSSGSGPIPEKASRLDERSSTAHFSKVQPRRSLEPPGTLASCISDDVPKLRRPQQTHCMEDSFISTEEIPPVPIIVVREAEGGSIAGIAKYQPKRRRSSIKTISEDRERLGEQGKSFDGRRQKELAKSSPLRNHNDISSREGNSAIKSLRRKLSSGA
mmetsp:Transcript_17006/g.28820  ORF Transcript_17006/g.28820 Transcript_17006/m.28820 type:complete len:902 (+) Transcript_17006:205-2910(+)